MKREWILSLLLLSASGMLCATLWPEKQQAGTFVNVENKLADDAGCFTRELLELARKNDRKNFAARCHDLKNRDLPRQFATLRKVKLADSPDWRVQKLDRRDDLYMVLVETRNGGAFRCALARNPRKSEWKFAGLSDE